MNTKIVYDQPFDHKEYGSERNRIPALYTLNDGSVMAFQKTDIMTGIM